MNSLAKGLCEKFGEGIYRDSYGQDVVYLPSSSYKAAVEFLKTDLDVIMCLDVTAVDYLGAHDRVHVDGVTAQRFEVVANFISHQRNERIRLIVPIEEHDTVVDSITPLFPGMNFGEREVYDMYGITFTGHPDMTRILMPDEWEGFPLRKDDAPARIPVNFTDDLPKVQS